MEEAQEEDNWSPLNPLLYTYGVYISYDRKMIFIMQRVQSTNHKWINHIRLSRQGNTQLIDSSEANNRTGSQNKQIRRRSATRRAESL